MDSIFMSLQPLLMDVQALVAISHQLHPKPTLMTLIQSQHLMEPQLVKEEKDMSVTLVILKLMHLVQQLLVSKITYARWINSTVSLEDQSLFMQVKTIWD
jgi:hypothetical protein